MTKGLALETVHYGRFWLLGGRRRAWRRCYCTGVGCGRQILGSSSAWLFLAFFDFTSSFYFQYTDGVKDLRVSPDC
jgi:hypothetical protein